MTYVKFLHDVPSENYKELFCVRHSVGQLFFTLKTYCSSFVASDLCCDSSIQLEKDLLHEIRGKWK